MEEAKRILEYLQQQHRSGVEENKAVSQGGRTKELQQWNDRLEDLIFGPIEEQLKALPSYPLAKADFQVLVKVSKELHLVFLETLLLGTTTDESFHHHEDHEEEALSESSSVDAILELLDDNKNSPNDMILADGSGHLAEVVRALRNWLRFYLQIYPTLESSRLSPAQLVAPFQTKKMLKLYLILLERQVQQQHEHQPGMARHFGQILFYATFHPMPSADEHMHSLFTFLLEEMELPRRVLGLCLQTDSVGSVLALTQNIHNLAGSMQQSPSRQQQFLLVKANVSEASFECCPWLPSRKNHHDQNNDEEEITLRGLFDRLLEYCLCESEPPFPGDGESSGDDYRAELVGEIWRTLFALRIGAALTPCEQRVIPVILQLDASNSKSAECQRSVMAILTETGSSMAAVLVDQSMEALLNILNQQIDEVVTTSQIDDAAAAALTPVLLTFYRFCQANEDFRNETREAVFPLFSAAPPQSTTAAPPNNNANKMLPEDAPEGTLRWKLIRLLTWPQSHIKRLAAEILWILCGSNPQEFSRRVGMGNALPFLAAKGHAQLPSNVFQ